MGNEKVVIIHQIQDSLTNLEDTIDYFKPDYVMLVSSKYYSEDKPNMALMELRERNIRALGDHVENVEFFDLFSIEDAWHKTTMMEVYELFGQIKATCEERAGKHGCKFYAGLADGTSLMTVGIAFSAVLLQMKTYFTRGRRTYYNKQYVLEIDNLNQITTTKSWLEQNYRNPSNLRYLNEIILLEEDGEEEIIAEKIQLRVDPKTVEAVRNAINVLEKRGLIITEGKRPKVVHSTELGKLTIRMFYNEYNK
mgnify:CR=1 FL=1|tara:strand:- start:4897 stop:5652 length:756 start_codon:yes stop_codon:yes gene_type:complete